MSTVPIVSVVNESTTMSDADIAKIVPALQLQVAQDFRPYWGQGAKLEVAPAVAKGAWGLVVLDDADQAGALGYHDLTAAGLPLAKVFARTTQENGGTPSVVMSHELLEMLADPWIDTAVQVGAHRFYALEVCDAPESEAYAYSIAGVTVSDFVLPTWFRRDGRGPFDFMSHIADPLQLLPGGYIGQWTPSTGWTQRLAARAFMALNNRFVARASRGLPGLAPPARWSSR